MGTFFTQVWWYHLYFNDYHLMVVTKKIVLKQNPFRNLTVWENCINKKNSLIVGLFQWSKSYFGPWNNKLTFKEGIICFIWIKVPSIIKNLWLKFDHELSRSMEGMILCTITLEKDFLPLHSKINYVFKLFSCIYYGYWLSFML